MQELLLHDAIHLGVSMKGYYSQIPAGWEGHSVSRSREEPERRDSAVVTLGR